MKSTVYLLLAAIACGSDTEWPCITMHGAHAIAASTTALGQTMVGDCRYLRDNRPYPTLEVGPARPSRPAAVVAGLAATAAASPVISLPAPLTPPRARPGPDGSDEADHRGDEGDQGTEGGGDAGPGLHRHVSCSLVMVRSGRFRR